jgi:hypothetical protein
MVSVKKLMIIKCKCWKKNGGEKKKITQEFTGGSPLEKSQQGYILLLFLDYIFNSKTSYLQENWDR